MSRNSVRVKALEGRVVRVSPQGAFVPSDRFIVVDHTPYVERLISIHGDLVVEPTKAAAAAKKED